MSSLQNESKTNKGKGGGKPRGPSLCQAGDNCARGIEMNLCERRSSTNRCSMTNAGKYVSQQLNNVGREKTIAALLKYIAADRKRQEVYNQQKQQELINWKLVFGDTRPSTIYQPENLSPDYYNPAESTVTHMSIPSSTDSFVSTDLLPSFVSPDLQPPSFVSPDLQPSSFVSPDLLSSSFVSPHLLQPQVIPPQVIPPESKSFGYPYLAQQKPSGKNRAPKQTFQPAASYIDNLLLPLSLQPPSRSQSKIKVTQPSKSQSRIEPMSSDTFVDDELFS